MLPRHGLTAPHTQQNSDFVPSSTFCVFVYKSHPILVDGTKTGHRHTTKHTSIMAIYRTLSSVLLVGKLLARAHCWAPPAWFRPLGTTAVVGGRFSSPGSSSATCPAPPPRRLSSLSIDTAETAPAPARDDHHVTKPTTMLIADDASFLKPDRDPRRYRMIRLPNNLQVLLVSDQLAVGGTGVEAASVHVQAGHFDDTVPGLAHFHEHLLFLGESFVLLACSHDDEKKQMMMDDEPI